MDEQPRVLQNRLHSVVTLAQSHKEKITRLAGDQLLPVQSSARGYGGQSSAYSYKYEISIFREFINQSVFLQICNSLLDLV